MNYNIKLRLDKTSDNQINFFLKENLPYNFTDTGFSWQYDRNESVFCYVEDLDKNVIGVNGVIPYHLSFNYQKIKTAKNETGYISKDLQGKGIFKALYQELVNNTFKNGYKVIWGFTKLGKIWTKLGSKVYSNFLCDAFLVINPSFKFQKHKFPKDSFIKSLVRFLYTYVIFVIKFKFHNKISNQIKLNFGQRNLEILEDFYNKLKINEKNLVFLEIDKLLKENFIDSNPYQEYENISFVNANNDLIGYILYTKCNNSINIADIQFLNENDLSSIIENFLIQKDFLKGIYDITFFGNYENKKMNLVFSYFKKRGAKLSFSEMDIVVRADDSLIDQEFLNVKNWYINLLWTECVNR